MADLKKIRLVDLTELEVYNISEFGDSLSIDFIGKSLDVLSEIFQKQEVLSVIQYYVGFDLSKSYADYIIYVSASEQANILISIDYTVNDETTESKFKETRENIQTVVIRKRTLSERIQIIEERLGV